MKRWAPSLIVLILLFSLAFVGVSLAQANDPYAPPQFFPFDNPSSSPSPTPDESPPASGPGCSIQMRADEIDTNSRCFPTLPGGFDPPLGFDDDDPNEPGGPNGPGGGNGGNGDDVLDKNVQNLPQERGATVPDAQTALPFTGTEILLILVIGLSATVVGFVIVRRSRAR